MISMLTGFTARLSTLRQGGSASAVKTLLLSLAVVALAVPMALPSADAQEAPLPDTAAFLANVRENLKSNRALLAPFTYREKRQDIQIGRFGGVSEGPIRIYEVHPAPDEALTYRRLISIDGVPATPEQVEQSDREQQERANERLERLKRAGGSPEARERLEEEARRNEQRVVDDLFQLFEMELVGRETIDGHVALVGTFAPKPNYRPATETGRFLQNFRGRGWVNEEDHELIRIEAEALEDVTFGWGLLGRLHSGSLAVVHRRQLADGAWVPVQVHFRASGRSMVFRRFAVESTTEYSNFRRLDPAERRAGFPDPSGG